MSAYRVTSRAEARRICWAAGTDAGNRSMRAAGRTQWAPDDYDAAAETFAKLYRELAAALGFEP